MKSFAATLLPGATFGTLFRGISLTGVRKAFTVAHERHKLAMLDDRMLADIGVTQDEAGRETARPFWDIPAGR